MGLANRMTVTEAKKAQQDGVKRAKESVHPSQLTEMPTGSISKVLSWVGQDADRAQQALDHENGQTEPRSSLVERLEAIANPGD